MRRRLVAVGLLLLVAIGAWLLLYPPLALVDPGEYDRTTVAVYDSAGEQRATVEVRIADTREKRRIGLSRTDSLGNDTGMLFVHDESASHSYVMRNMSFPLDIIFLGPDGRINTVHHAPVDGGSYEGRGKYVLEVPRGWTNETGVGPGGRVEISEGLGTDG